MKRWLTVPVLAGVAAVAARRLVGARHRVHHLAEAEGLVVHGRTAGPTLLHCDRGVDLDALRHQVIAAAGEHQVSPLQLLNLVLFVDGRPFVDIDADAARRGAIAELDGAGAGPLVRVLHEIEFGLS